VVKLDKVLFPSPKLLSPDVIVFRTLVPIPIFSLEVVDVKLPAFFPIYTLSLFLPRCKNKSVPLTIVPPVEEVVGILRFPLFKNSLSVGVSEPIPTLPELSSKIEEFPIVVDPVNFTTLLVVPLILVVVIPDI
jgi:hypothetical protein